jgi:hypothetical protein
MNVLSQTFSGWFSHDLGLRARLHAAAHRLVVRATFRQFGPPSAPMSATCSVHDSSARRGSAPGESPAPTIAFPSAAGWVPALPPELRAGPPSRLTQSGVFHPVADERQGGQDRRFQERRIRDDGSPYGVERRSEVTRVGERRADTAPPVSRSGSRVSARSALDYAPHHSDLLARFHGR